MSEQAFISAASSTPASRRAAQGAQGIGWPERPLVSIRPRKGWAALNLRDLWVHRELLYSLTWRDVKVRYKQTTLGAAWAIIQPLFTMLIFTFFFGRLANIPSGGIPYPLFFYTTLVAWTYFASTLGQAGNSLVSNAPLITKIYFPRILLPASSALSGLLDFGVGSSFLVAMMLYYRIAPSWKI